MYRQAAWQIDHFFLYRCSRLDAVIAISANKKKSLFLVTALMAFYFVHLESELYIKLDVMQACSPLWQEY